MKKILATPIVQEFIAENPHGSIRWPLVLHAVRSVQLVFAKASPAKREGWSTRVARVSKDRPALTTSGLLIFRIGMMRKCIPLFLFILFQLNLFAIKKGSNTSVSIQEPACFPATDSDNEMCSFGWFRNGFSLENENTSCIFSSIFPVSGTISLNGGSLHLNTDLHFTYPTSYETFGTIYANNKTLEYDSTISHIFDLDYVGNMHNVNLVTNTDFTLVGNINFFGECSFNARNRLVRLDPRTNIIVGQDSTLSIKDAIITGLQSDNIRCSDDTGKIIYDNVTLILSDDYMYDTGGLEFKNKVDITGNYNFYYETKQTTTINANSEMLLRDDILFAVGKLAGITKTPFYFVDQSSKLSVNNANFLIGSRGLQLTRGTFNLLGKVLIDIDSTNTSNGLILGNGTNEGNMIANCCPASYVIFNSGHITYQNIIDDGIRSRSVASKLVRDPDNIFYIAQDCLFSDITIKLSSDSPLIVDEDKQVFYDNCKMILPGVKFIVNGSRYDAYTFLLNGGKEIFMQEGILPLNLVAVNSGNIIRGNGGISGGIILPYSNSEIVINLDGKILNDITIGGGKVILENNLNFGYGNKFVGEGVVDLSHNTLNLSTQDLNWTSTIYWDSSNGKINLDSNVFLSGTWTFSGNCVIDGNDNKLDLSLGGKIYLEKGSTLNFKNIKISFLADTNVSCLDDSGTIIFDSVRCKLFDDYYFKKGHFEVDDYLEIYNFGNNTFYYQSFEQSIIKKSSAMILYPSVIFSYDPPVANKNLIYMDNLESEICLIGATLHSTTTGLQLTRGRLLAKENCYIKSDAKSRAEGIIFGDGNLFENNLNIKICSGSTLEQSSGYVIYKNLS